MFEYQAWPHGELHKVWAQLPRSLAVIWWTNGPSKIDGIMAYFRKKQTYNLFRLRSWCSQLFFSGCWHHGRYPYHSYPSVFNTAYFSTFYGCCFIFSWDFQGTNSDDHQFRYHAWLPWTGHRPTTIPRWPFKVTSESWQVAGPKCGTVWHPWRLYSLSLQYKYLFHPVSCFTWLRLFWIVKLCWTDVLLSIMAIANCQVEEEQQNTFQLQHVTAICS